MMIELKQEILDLIESPKLHAYLMEDAERLKLRDYVSIIAGAPVSLKRKQGLLYKLQKSLKNPDQYAYGDAWENTHVYNSLSQFVNFWGGDYFDWTDPKTKDAARYMKSMLDEKNTSPAQFVDQYEQMEEKSISTSGNHSPVRTYDGPGRSRLGENFRYCGENCIHDQ